MEPFSPESNGNPNAWAAAAEVDIGEELVPGKVTYLRGHVGASFVCEWNPDSDFLGSGSMDNTARIWDLNDSKADATGTLTEHTQLYHPNPMVHSERSKYYVTTIHWKPDGSLLATASMDGKTRIFNRDGRLVGILRDEGKSVWALKWTQGEFILTGNDEGTVIIWNTLSGKRIQKFSFHQGRVLDVDWQPNSISFASCGVDGRVYVCELCTDYAFHYPLNCFSGHTGEVNAVKWQSQGVLLASCSDDRTVKIWDVNHQSYRLNLRGHTEEVYAVKWSPTGPGSSNPNANVILVSSGQDATVRLWDPELGLCLRTLTLHSEPIYAVAFSPDGKYLATGSWDSFVHIWTANGELVHSFKGPAGIHDVCWNAQGNKIGASTDNGTVVVLDFLKPGHAQTYDQGQQQLRTSDHFLPRRC